MQPEPEPVVASWQLANVADRMTADKLGQLEDLGDGQDRPLDRTVGLRSRVHARCVRVPMTRAATLPLRPERVSDLRLPLRPVRYSPDMKAAVQTRYGPPDVVRISEMEKPAPKDNEVLVQVRATTVNRTDCAYRAARPFFMRFLTGLTRPRAEVLGTEFAGVVEAVGGGVTSFKAGDRVFGYNEGRFGAHAEYMSIPEDGSLATMPANVTYQEAAPQYRGFALCPGAHQGGEDPHRAARPRLWCHRSHRLSGGPAAEEPRCRGDGGLRHGQRGAGQGAGR